MASKRPVRRSAARKAAAAPAGLDSGDVLIAVWECLKVLKGETDLAQPSPTSSYLDDYGVDLSNDTLAEKFANCLRARLGTPVNGDQASKWKFVQDTIDELT